MKLRNIVFIGTPAFAVPTLIKLSQTGFKPVLCITMPDKPKGRKKVLSPPEVKVAAEKLNIPVLQPDDINDVEVLKKLRYLDTDLIITAAYGGYLKKEIRKLPKLGCINLHPSLLPKYRGSSPVNAALFCGDKITGNTIFKIVANMDAGPILFQEETEILPEENYTELQNRLANSGAENVVKLLKQIEEEVKDNLKELTSYRTQNSNNAIFSGKIDKEYTLLNWNDTAEEICNKVRGLAVKPGAVCNFRQAKIKIIKIEITENKSNLLSGAVSEIKKNIGLFVCTQTFDVLLKLVQPAGKKIMSSHDYNLGAKIQIGEKFGI